MTNRDFSEHKNIFVILGFARSGTSVISRSLKALGIDLGNHLVTATQTNKWNPTGFWEDSDILYTVHMALYQALGEKMRGIRLIDEARQTSDQVSDARELAIKLLNQRFKTTNHWGFKDPGTAKVLPFWSAIFKAMEIEDHYIIALRNPLSSALSYSTLTKTTLELSLLLWLMHMIPAIEGTSGKKRVVVSYEQMMEDPRKQLERIKNTLNIPKLSMPSDIDQFANAFLDKQLHHNQHTLVDLASHPAMAVIPLCLDVYALLLKVARDEMALEDELFLTSWQKIKNELEKVYPLYGYLDTVLQNETALKIKLARIHQSIFWKMIGPLHALGDRLRLYRLKKKKRKRLMTAYR